MDRLCEFFFEYLKLSSPVAPAITHVMNLWSMPADWSQTSERFKTAMRQRSEKEGRPVVAGRSKSESLWTVK